MGDLADVSMAWLDRWWDPEVGLLWNMEGSFDGQPARSFHCVPQSAWYAFGLCARGGPGDEERAVGTIEALLGCQYDDAGTPWHGSFSRVFESPHPRLGAVMWVDFDPNWRQFIGTTFQLLLQPGQPGAGLPADLQRRMQAALDLTVAGEPPGRVPPTYSNIALMRTWLEVERGRAGAEDDARAVVAAFDVHGAFEEYGSPTYYGIDLYALALWRDRSSSPALREWGGRLEEALWRDIARWYHPDLGNLCGPFSRSYGMDMTSYTSLLGLFLWRGMGREAAPVPDLAGPHGHAHDLALGPLVDHLGPRIPTDVAPALRTFAGEHTVTQTISSSPRRRATGWLSDAVMLGGETGDLAVEARGQFMPATVHWRMPDGVGWIRLVHHAPASAVAGPGRLTVATHPHRREGRRAPELQVHAPGADLSGATWALPGLTLEVDPRPATAVGPTMAGGPLATRVIFPEDTVQITLSVGPS